MSARVAEVLALLRDAAIPLAEVGGSEEDAPLYRSDADAIAAAQVLAMLELAEQQRISNRIALADAIARVEIEYKQNGSRAHLTGDVTGLFQFTGDPDRVILKDDVREGLGL